MVKVVEMGLPIDDEALFTHNARGFLELMSWVAFGARSSEDPASLVWSQVTATLVTTATGLVKMKVKPSITAVAASITGVVVQDQLPAIWRIRVVHSAAGSWTYSLGVVLYS